jgi:hypothetical protein
LKLWTWAPLFFGSYNLIAWIIYSTVGSSTTSDIAKKGLEWVFYLFNPIYMLASGAISLLGIIGAIIIMIAKKSRVNYGIIAIVINVLYIILYMRWISMQ